jgi:hypothetical protein
VNMAARATPAGVAEAAAAAAAPGAAPPGRHVAAAHVHPPLEQLRQQEPGSVVCRCCKVGLVLRLNVACFALRSSSRSHMTRHAGGAGGIWRCFGVAEAAAVLNILCASAVVCWPLSHHGQVLRSVAGSVAHHASCQRLLAAAVNDEKGHAGQCLVAAAHLMLKSALVRCVPWMSCGICCVLPLHPVCL